MSPSDKKADPPPLVAIWTAVISVYILRGSTFLAIRIAIETIPPFLIAAIRFLIAGGTLYLIRRFRVDVAPRRAEWRSTAIVGTLLLVGGNGGVVWAEQRVASGVAATIVVGSVALTTISQQASIRSK